MIDDNGLPHDVKLALLTIAEEVKRITRELDFLGRNNMRNPKMCDCGEQAKVIDCRPRDDRWYRRYRCPKCKEKWSTYETRTIEGEHIFKYNERNEVIL